MRVNRRGFFAGVLGFLGLLKAEKPVRTWGGPKAIHMEPGDSFTKRVFEDTAVYVPRGAKVSSCVFVGRDSGVEVRPGGVVVDCLFVGNSEGLRYG